MQRPRKVRARPTRLLRFVLCSFVCLSVVCLNVCLSCASVCLSAHTRSSVSLVGALPNWYTHRVVRSPRHLKVGLIPK